MLEHLAEIEQKRNATATAAAIAGGDGHERTYSDASALTMDGSLDLGEPITLQLDRTNSPDSRTHSTGSNGSADTSRIGLVAHSELNSSVQSSSSRLGLSLGGVSSGGFDGVGLTDHDNPMSHDVEQHHKSGCCERAANVAKLIKSTHHCLLLYISLMTLNLFVVIWEVSGGGKHWVVILVESVVNFLLVLEVTLSLVSEGCNYLRNWVHVVDLIVTVFCVLFFVIFVAYDETRPVSGAEDESKTGSDTSSSRDQTAAFIDSFLLVTRYLVQILRLLFFVWRSRSTVERVVVDDVPELSHIAINPHDHTLHQTNSIHLNLHMHSHTGVAGTSGSTTSAAGATEHEMDAAGAAADHARSSSIELVAVTSVSGVSGVSGATPGAWDDNGIAGQYDDFLNSHHPNIAISPLASPAAAPHLNPLQTPTNADVTEY